MVGVVIDCVRVEVRVKLVENDKRDVSTLVDNFVVVVKSMSSVLNVIMLVSVVGFKIVVGSLEVES